MLSVHWCLPATCLSVEVNAANISNCLGHTRLVASHQGSFLKPVQDIAPPLNSFQEYTSPSACSFWSTIEMFALWLKTGMCATKKVYDSLHECVKDTQTRETDRDVEKSDKKRDCLLYTSPSPRDQLSSRMPSSA